MTKKCNCFLTAWKSLLDHWSEFGGWIVKWEEEVRHGLNVWKCLGWKKWSIFHAEMEKLCSGKSLLMPCSLLHHIDGVKLKTGKRPWQSWLMRPSFNLQFGDQISDRKYFHILFVSHLNPNLLGVNSWALFVNLHVYWLILLDPTRHVAKNP